MYTDMSGSYARPLECMEMTDRYEAEPRIANFVDTDDLVALDGLCLRGRDLVDQQLIGSSMVLSKELIRDLTICLGEIVMRYLRADWFIGVDPLGDGEYSEPAWVLVLLADDARRSMRLEEYVTRRFFEQTDTSFPELLEQIIVMAKQLPGLYLGGYESGGGERAS